ncbi:MAG TPA: ferredoxin reductase family protein [Desulfobaccales bacterium]
MRSKLSRIILYLAILLLPCLVVAAFHFKTKDIFIYNIGRCLALLAFAILVLQVVLAARLKWVEEPFGLNLTFPFHRRMGTLAAALLIMHPLFLALGGGGGKLIYGLKVDWYIWVGKTALVLLLINVGVSLWRARLGIKFEKWRRCHDILGPLVLVLVFVHSWYASEDLSVRPMQVLWVVFLGGAVLLFAYHRLLRPARLRNHLYQVTEVRQESPKVWTLKFAPPPGEPRFNFLPGQFQFVTLLRGRGLPEEEHHFTISSSPTAAGYHAATIKESGDFTASIGQTINGDAAIIQAPFGRFSYVLHPEWRDLAFIAGGIGITPLMSNLRHMRDTRAERRVLLLYANRDEPDIIFRKELARMEAEGRPDLKVVHILSRPGAAWQGERGHLDREKLARVAGDHLATSTFWLCCPSPMLKSTVAILRDLGVPYGRITYEFFSL